MNNLPKSYQKIDTDSGWLRAQDSLKVKHLDKYVDKKVCVFISTLINVRSGFHTHIAVEGILEKHSDGDSRKYRVLVENSTYAYFTFNDVAMISRMFEKDRPNIGLYCVQRAWDWEANL